jgi:FkbM family methyltransferase
MKTRHVKLLDGSDYTIQLEDQKLIEHFENPSNYTEAILEQFNNVNYYQDFIKEDDKFILDIGANVGLFALYVSPWAEKIVCVEPTPDHFSLLNKLTEGFDNIERIHGAASNVTGVAYFYTSQSNTTTNSLIARDVKSTIQVPSYTIKDIVEKAGLERVDFIKMDIEGSEYIVLDEKTLEYIAENVPKILVEFHDCHVENHAHKYIKLFTELGFTANHFHWDSVFFYKN